MRKRLSNVFKKSVNYNDQILFLLAILVVALVGYYVFGGVEGMKNCCGTCGGGGCGGDMHWGWPGKMPPAHQWYSSGGGHNEREKAKSFFGGLMPM